MDKFKSDENMLQYKNNDSTYFHILYKFPILRLR